MPTFDPDNKTTPVTDAQLRDQALHWLVRLTSGHVSAMEANAFLRWCARSEEHRRAFALAKRVWDALDRVTWQVAEPPSSNVIPITCHRIRKS